MSRFRYDLDRMVMELVRTAELETFLEDFAGFELLCSIDHRVERLFTSPITPPYKAASIVQTLRPGSFRTFLQRIAENGSAPGYPGIRERLLRIVSGNGVEPAQIISAVQLDTDQIRRIRERLHKMSGRNVFAYNTISSEVIAGFFIRFQGRLMDYSVHGAMQKAKTALLAAE